MDVHDDPRTVREQKLRDLAATGLPLLPRRFGPTRSSGEVKQAYAALEGERVRVAGRIVRVRLMGRAAFAHIQDQDGQIQLYFKRDDIGDNAYEYFKLLDIGDIVGVQGAVFTTKTGEISIMVAECVLLAKSFLPLPDKYHGLTDVEARYRRRYLDLIANDETRNTFRIRSHVVWAVRRYLDGAGFTEVETPILQPLYGGAAANPFVAHYNSLDMDAYLRIATELYLKRLIVAGFERVYEIGKDFRNEGFSRKNSPEFTMLELYQAYSDYTDMMRLLEAMFVCCAEAALGSSEVVYQEHVLSFTPPWRRITIRDALKEFADVDYSPDITGEQLRDIAVSHGVSFDPAATDGEIVEELVSSLVEPHLIQPTFLCEFPLDFPGSLLARRSERDPRMVERFELYIGGMEIANAFTEENDPFDQRLRMEAAADATGEQHNDVDEDFLLALSYGMPPAGGLGFGIDRLVMVLANVHHIRETILFPLLRPRENDSA